MKNALTKLIGLFTHNWGLKILALALAIVIYYALKPSDMRKGTNRETTHDRKLFQPR